MVTRILYISDPYLVFEPGKHFLPTQHISVSGHSEGEVLGRPEEIFPFLDKGVKIIACHAAPISKEVMDLAPNLELICVARGGPANVDLEEARVRDIAVTNVPGRNAQAVAEYVLATILNYSRGLVQAYGNRETSVFSGAKFKGHELAALTVGIVGLGWTGRTLSRMLTNFGVRVLICDPAYPSTSLEKVLSESDVVTIHVRTDECVIGSDQISQMQRHALLVNTSRPHNVDSEAAINAYLDGKLGGLAFDVTQSSLPIKSNGVWVTPHVAGATFESDDRAREGVEFAIREFLLQKP